MLCKRFRYTQAISIATFRPVTHIKTGLDVINSCKILILREKIRQRENFVLFKCDMTANICGQRGRG